MAASGMESGRPGDDGSLHIELDSYEGPLDLMLSLARSRKLDLGRISVLEIAEQYLDFVARARRLELDVAADYLVMAAWLTWLKSRLLLPEAQGEDIDENAQAAAARLAWQLRRLDAMRRAGDALLRRPRLGQDFFPRGAPEGTRVVQKSRYEAGLHELLAAYTGGRLRRMTRVVRPGQGRRKLWSIRQARRRLERMIHMQTDWAPIDHLLTEWLGGPEDGRSVLAASFGASLEMAREGRAELRQSAPFAPLYLRGRRKEGRAGGKNRGGKDK